MHLIAPFKFFSQENPNPSPSPPPIRRVVMRHATRPDSQKVASPLANPAYAHGLTNYRSCVRHDTDSITMNRQ